MIGIIDYGRGNLRSVQNALNYLGADNVISDDPQTLSECEKLILPGVGAFRDCMEQIQNKGLDQLIRKEVDNGKPLLGICLGMQMLFEKSYEKGETPGLGFIQGEVVRIEAPSLPVPEIGWNDLIFDQDSPLKRILSENPYVYYVHSYYASQVENGCLIAHSQYGSVSVAGIVKKKNILGTQFHPEKSGQEGLKILKYFVEDFT